MKDQAHKTNGSHSCMGMAARISQIVYSDMIAHAKKNGGLISAEMIKERAASFDKILLKRSDFFEGNYSSCHATPAATGQDISDSHKQMVVGVMLLYFSDVINFCFSEQTLVPGSKWRELVCGFLVEEAKKKLGVDITRTVVSRFVDSLKSGGSGWSKKEIANDRQVAKDINVAINYYVSISKDVWIKKMCADLNAHLQNGFGDSLSDRMLVKHMQCRKFVEVLKRDRDKNIRRRNARSPAQ